MAFVVTEPCFGLASTTDCVVVCPSDCFREAANPQMLFIEPDLCIDCDACTPECPVEAIYHEDNVPEEWQDFVAPQSKRWRPCAPRLSPCHAEAEPLAHGDGKRSEPGL